MDALYQSYLERRGKREERARAKRKRLGAEGELGSDEEGLDEERAPEYQPGSDAEADQQQVGLAVRLLLLPRLCQQRLSSEPGPDAQGTGRSRAGASYHLVRVWPPRDKLRARQ